MNSSGNYDESFFFNLLTMFLKVIQAAEPIAQNPGGQPVSAPQYRTSRNAGASANLLQPGLVDFVRFIKDEMYDGQLFCVTSRCTVKRTTRVLMIGEK